MGTVTLLRFCSAVFRKHRAGKVEGAADQDEGRSALGGDRVEGGGDRA